MPKVVLENLNKVFAVPGAGAVRAVSELSLEISPGERMVLVGPSGCGKSTTLRLIAGLEKASSGKILIGGRDVTSLSPARRDVAMVFQSLALFPHLTVYENMAFGLRIRKVAAGEIKSRVADAAKLLEIADCLARKPAELSGGQRQRAALGRAIVRQAGILLLDEPLSNLDAPLRAQMRQDLAALHQGLGCTMIYVTHDQAEAMSLGSRIAVMNQGRLQQVDEPMKVYNHPSNRFVAGFIGVPQMNFFLGELRKTGSQLAFAETSPASGGAEGRGFVLNLKEPWAKALTHYEGKPVILGIRPENIVPVFKGSGNAANIPMIPASLIAENLGADTFIHSKTAFHPFTSRIASAGKFAVSEIGGFFADTAAAHFFDVATGAAIHGQ